MSFLVQYAPEQLDTTVKIEKAILKNFSKLGIKPNEFTLYVLITYLSSEDKEMPTQEELATMLGVQERQLKSIISEMKKKSFLKVNRSKQAPKYDFSGLIYKAMALEN